MFIRNFKEGKNTIFTGKLAPVEGSTDRFELPATITNGCILMLFYKGLLLENDINYTVVDNIINLTFNVSLNETLDYKIIL